MVLAWKFRVNDYPLQTWVNGLLLTTQSVTLWWVGKHEWACPVLLVCCASDHVWEKAKDPGWERSNLPVGVEMRGTCGKDPPQCPFPPLYCLREASTKWRRLGLEDGVYHCARYRKKSRKSLIGWWSPITRERYLGEWTAADKSPYTNDPGNDGNTTVPSIPMTSGNMSTYTLLMYWSCHRGWLTESIGITFVICLWILCKVCNFRSAK